MRKSTCSKPGQSKSYELRKQLEIKHSNHRRSIVKSFEYQTDSAVDSAASPATDIGHDEEYKRNFSNMKFYSVTRSSVLYKEKLLKAKVKGSVALDYCCGNGEVAIEMAKLGAKTVYGIDISPVAIENAKALADSAGVTNRCEFHVMDAEQTTFDDNTFDLIHEYGALHHLELNLAYEELSRLLKPTGKLVCTETMRHNPVIHLYRKLTPHLRTEWEVEHILGIPEIEKGKSFFGKVEYQLFHLAVLGAVPLRHTPIFHSVLRILEGIDSILLSLPVFRKLAWIAVIEYSLPNKS